MKKIILSLTAIVLLFASCDKDCKMGRPQDVKSVDWENYNDVYTVYWNYVFYNKPGKINEEDRDKEIMVCGFAYDWRGLPSAGLGFYIADNTNEKYPCVYIPPLMGNRDSILQLDSILKAGYLANMKCYVKGKLDFRNLTPDMGECQTYQPIITINNIDDIYFKEEE